MNDGVIQRTHEVHCGGCGSYNPVGGRRKIDAEHQLRTEGWQQIRGRWFCAPCSSRESESS